MKISNNTLINGFVGLAIFAGASSALVGCNGADSISVNDQSDTLVLKDSVLDAETVAEVADVQTDILLADDAVLDANEQTHLVFMREEEKLARDVYLKLGSMYPRFSNFWQY